MIEVAAVFFIWSSSLYAYSPLDGEDAPSFHRDIESITSKRCAICHKGPYLDLQVYPFQSDRFPTPAQLGTEIYRRTHLEKWGKMPPINAIALSPEELALIDKWIASGMSP